MKAKRRGKHELRAQISRTGVFPSAGFAAVTGRSEEASQWKL